MKPPQILILPQTITVTWKGKLHTFDKSTPQHRQILAAALIEDWERIYEILDQDSKAEVLGAKIQAGELTRADGKPCHPTLERLLVTHTKETLTAFHKACEKNPRPGTTDQLLDFLKSRGLPLTPKGTFLGWKSVTKAFRDHHTQTIDNSPGKAPYMPPSQCNLNPNSDCGSGYHIGNFTYANAFRTENRLVICEIHPQFVTSVPKSNTNKLRCHHYQVLEEYFGGRNIDEAETHILKLAERRQKETTCVPPDTEVLTTKGTKPVKDIDPKTDRFPQIKTKGETPEATKKEILAYALHLKGTRKGDHYTAQRIKAKFGERGLTTLKDIAENPKNPSRINASTKQTLQGILGSKAPKSNQQ